MGLKLYLDSLPSSAGRRLNRTSVGLKPVLLTSCYVPDISLNRTSVGLKLWAVRAGGLRGLVPQSNQRGIETFQRLRRPPAIRSGLNRTSVGLKRDPFARGDSAYSTPQSNQRGIETTGAGPGGRHASPPQSNQRGIETQFWDGASSRLSPRLNRTSVGLKPRAGEISKMSCNTPQSNQRGIETQDDRDPPVPRLPPQSNQRGIETEIGLAEPGFRQDASIEPAWD